MWWKKKSHLPTDFSPCSIYRYSYYYYHHHHHHHYLLFYVGITIKRAENEFTRARTGPHINKTCAVAERVCRGVWFDVIDSDVSVFIHNTYVPTPTYLLGRLYTYLRYYRHRHEIETLLFRSRLPFIARATPRNETRLPATFVKVSLGRTRTGPACRTHAITRHYTRPERSMKGRSVYYHYGAVISFPFQSFLVQYLSSSHVRRARARNTAVRVRNAVRHLPIDSAITCRYEFVKECLASRSIDSIK